MRKATDILKEQINECDLKFTQKEKLVILWCIKEAQINAINCTVAAILERKRTDFFLSNEAIIEEQKKLKEEL